MSSLETKELEFARQVRRALDENAASIAPATVDRLAAARRAALSRKKPKIVSVPAFVPAFTGMGMGDGMPPVELPQRRRSPLRRFALAWPLVALVVSLVGIAYWEDQQRTAELADIDAAMLSDDLPLNAYLDYGFKTYLSRAH
ncbi:MAG: Putative transmembrane protein [uncultured Paraburkholderia sp.]|nr:MAG: Putative transmembrane protein [uncultured Paraburkholderia sp.]CAH2931360.1 MAG: Putative transmembrane protein [uncultured Paraburkholderia sp.]